MLLSRATLGIATILALGASAAAAAPATTPSSGGATPQNQCPTPDAVKCLTKGYLDSVCGQKHLAVCRPFAEAAMQALYEGTAVPKLKMLRPKTSEMPQHVVTGKYFAYKKKPAFKKQGAPMMVEKVYRKAKDPLAGASGMDMSSTPPVDRVTKVDPSEAAKFHRNPEWKANGIGVRSCKEYAYARSYNATRFIDAASACRGDRECTFAVAYMPAPTGIAKHKLFDESGVQMTRQLSLPTGKKPKNDMFVAGMDEFVTVKTTALPNGLTAHDGELAALKSALRSGKEYYELGLCSGGSCNATRKFADVWDWHKYLHGATANISQAEAEEYERRRARFRALLEQWSAAVNHEQSLGKGMILEQKIVLPFDMRAHDPFERYDREREYIERGVDIQSKFKQRFGAEIFNVPRAQAVQKIQQKAQQQHGSWQPGGGAMAVGLMAAPAPKSNKPSQPSQSTPTPAHQAGAALPNVDPAPWLTDPAAVSKCLAPGDWGLEMAYKGPISCRIEEFLIGEWRRKAAGQKSCLDLGNPECDWTLQNFEAGVLEQVQKLDVQVSDEAYCDAYLTETTFVDNPNNGGVSTVTVVKARLDATRKLVQEQLAAVSEYRRPHTAAGQPLGKDWEGGDFLGDKNWFAAGYEYGVGWEVAPVEKRDNGLVCQLAGSAHAEMAFDAWIIGGKIPVVDGAVRAEAKPASDGKAMVNAHLEMMGQSLFDSGGWKSAQTFQPSNDVGFGVKVPPGLKPRFDIYVGVPVSGQMWGELLFGSMIALTGEASVECKTGLPKFAVGAQYTPFFGAFGVGQVGVGIAGIASAGVRASLTLVMLGLPAEVGMKTVVKNGDYAVNFGAEIGLMLATMSGRVSLYVEFFGFDEEFELFRWKGFSTQVPLMPRLGADVSLVGLK